MPERLLNIGRVGAASQKQGCVGVPEIMPPYIRQLRSLEQGLEEPVDFYLPDTEVVEESAPDAGPHED